METISLLWTIVSIVGTTIVTVLGSVAGAAWWLKGQLTGAELAGVKAENAAHAVWRQFAEAQAKTATEQLKVVTEQLTAAQATIENLQKQIAAGAEKEVLANTTATASGEITAANNAVNRIHFASAVLGRDIVFGTTDHRPPNVGPR
jgi:hypothetical protein